MSQSPQDDAFIHCSPNTTLPQLWTISLDSCAYSCSILSLSIRGEFIITFQYFMFFLSQPLLLFTHFPALIFPCDSHTYTVIYLKLSIFSCEILNKLFAKVMFGNTYFSKLVFFCVWFFEIFFVRLRFELRALKHL
jgi:hypothetical protein